MQGYDGDGNLVTRVAPSGGVVADNMYIIGAEALVAQDTVAATEEAVFVRRGICKFVPKTSGETPVKGAKAFFNATSGKAEVAASATNYEVGTFDAAAASGDEYCAIVLDGRAVSVGGVPGDIQSVLPTTNGGLTGGGSSGPVTLGCNFGSAEHTVCQGNDPRLSDTRTPSSTLPHAASHATGEDDELTPSDIGACADDDARLSDARTPSSTLAHAASHATGESDAIAPSDIGACADDDVRLGVAAVDEVCAGGAVPVAPADGYRVFVNATAGGYTEGKIYTFTTGTGYDAGVALGDGQSVMVKGADPDLILGGDGEYDLFSDKLDANNLSTKEVTIALGATSGVTAADPDWVGATVIGCVPNSGNDQIVVSVAVAVDGVVTVTVGAAETAEAKFNVTALLA